MTRLQPSFFGSWRRPDDKDPPLTPIAASSATLREAKAQLYGELHQSLLHGMTLDDALAMAGKSWGTHTRRAFLLQLRFPNSVVQLILTLGGILLALPMLLWSLILPNPRRIIAALAQRLRFRVVKGLSLSESMRAYPSLFTAEEVRMVAFAEAHQQLNSGLENLHRYQQMDELSLKAIHGAAYPFFLLAIILQISSFGLVVIVPKFEDIFMQSGGDLPWITTFAVGHLYDRSGAYLLISTVLVGLMLVGWVIVCGRMLSGSLLSGYLSLVFFVVGAPFVLSTHPAMPYMIVAPFIALAMLMELLFGNMDYGWLIATGIVVTCYLIRRPMLSGWAELVQYVERRVEAVLRLLPFVGGATRRHEISQWLAAFSTALNAGYPTDRALHETASMGPRRLAKRTSIMASEVEKGLPLGQVISRARLLDSVNRFRLGWLERHGGLAAGVQSIALDAAKEARMCLHRVGRVSEVALLLVVGGAAAFILLVFYSPIFAIPRIIMNLDLGN